MTSQVYDLESVLDWTLKLRLGGWEIGLLGLSLMAQVKARKPPE